MTTITFISANSTARIATASSASIACSTTTTNIIITTSTTPIASFHATDLFLYHLKNQAFDIQRV